METGLLQVQQQIFGTFFFQNRNKVWFGYIQKKN